MGAHMNAAHQASSGLPTDAFPLDIPVFMGHYHMPQVGDMVTPGVCQVTQ
jgi:hypothetical protein